MKAVVSIQFLKNNFLKKQTNERATHCLTLQVLMAHRIIGRRARSPFSSPLGSTYQVKKKKKKERERESSVNIDRLKHKYRKEKRGRNIGKCSWPKVERQKDKPRRRRQVQWLWHSWQSGGFPFQRSGVRIQSFGKK